MQHLPNGTLLHDGRYRIVGVLGQGGFGITYKALQIELGRHVCVKEFFLKQFCDRQGNTTFVTLGTEGNRDSVERYKKKFIKEAQTVAELSHNNIVRIYDRFEENNTAYYVMEYIDGPSLSDIVKSRGKLPEADAVKYVRQVASALRHIHKKGINHLDVKPANIMVRSSDNSAMLIDFGMSKHYEATGNAATSTTPVGISAGYAPMEQYKMSGVATFTPETDIYALGATLYKLITGITPPDANDILNEGLPPMPGVSNNVAAAVTKAMQPRKVDRPKSVDEFLAYIDGTVTDDSPLILGVEVAEDEAATRLITGNGPHSGGDTTVVSKSPSSASAGAGAGAGTSSRGGGTPPPPFHGGFASDDNPISTPPPEPKRKNNMFVLIFVFVAIFTFGLVYMIGSREEMPANTPIPADSDSVALADSAIWDSTAVDTFAAATEEAMEDPTPAEAGYAPEYDEDTAAVSEYYDYADSIAYD